MSFVTPYQPNHLAIDKVRNVIIGPLERVGSILLGRVKAQVMHPLETGSGIAMWVLSEGLETEINENIANHIQVSSFCAILIFSNFSKPLVFACLG